MDFSHPKVHQIFGKADVIVYQRNVLTPDVLASMSYWRSLGKVVTVDLILDDAYPSLPPSNPAHAFWILNAANLPYSPVDALCEAMKHADALVSPSKILLKDYEHLIPGFHIPNYPRRKWYEPVIPKPYGSPDIEFGYEQQGEQITFMGRARPESEGWITLGWGGSISHVDSWVYSGIIPALKRIFDEFPQTRLKFCGHEGRIDYLLNNFGDRVIRQAGVKPEHWPYVVASFDIGLAPLDMRPVASNTGKEGEEKWEGGEYSYDERRSWLKGVEYLCAGVPWLATKCATYIDLERHGVLVENGEESWYKAMKDMVVNIKSRKILAADKKRWALKKFSMEANVQAYVDVYERIGNMKRSKGGSTLPNVLWNKYEYPTEQA